MSLRTFRSCVRMQVWIVSLDRSVLVGLFLCCRLDGGVFGWVESNQYEYDLNHSVSMYSMFLFNSTFLYPVLSIYFYGLIDGQKDSQSDIYQFYPKGENEWIVFNSLKQSTSHWYIYRKDTYPIKDRLYFTVINHSIDHFIHIKCSKEDTQVRK